MNNDRYIYVVVGETMKRKFLWLQVPEDSFDKAIIHMDNPRFLEVADALEKGKIFNK